VRVEKSHESICDVLRPWYRLFQRQSNDSADRILGVTASQTSRRNFDNDSHHR
jgi:hypothetical protein